MEKEIFNSKYIRIFFDKNTRIYKSIFLPETENMTDKDWKDSMNKVAFVIENCKPKFIIDDNRNKKYDYSPDIQTWTLELLIHTMNKIALEKYVQILPTHIIGKLTSEQIKELSKTDFSVKFKNKFVLDYESAVLWINEEL